MSRKKKRVIKHKINWNYIATLFALLATITTYLMISNEKEINLLKERIEYERLLKEKLEDSQDYELHKTLKEQREYIKYTNAERDKEINKRDWKIDSLEKRLKLNSNKLLELEIIETRKIDSFIKYDPSAKIMLIKRVHYYFPEDIEALEKEKVDRIRIRRTSLISLIAIFFNFAMIYFRKGRRRRRSTL